MVLHFISQGKSHTQGCKKMLSNGGEGGGADPTYMDLLGLGGSGGMLPDPPSPGRYCTF